MNEPSGHTLQVDAPADEKDPAAHCWHVDACGLAAKAPAAHSVQFANPVAALEKDPAAQLAHTDEPSALYVPLVHDAHVDKPARELYLPAAQSSQEDCAGADE